MQEATVISRMIALRLNGLTADVVFRWINIVQIRAGMLYVRWRLGTRGDATAIFRAVRKLRKELSDNYAH